MTEAKMLKKLTEYIDALAERCHTGDITQETWSQAGMQATRMVAHLASRLDKDYQPKFIDEMAKLLKESLEGPNE